MSWHLESCTLLLLCISPYLNSCFKDRPLVYFTGGGQILRTSREVLPVADYIFAVNSCRYFCPPPVIWSYVLIPSVFQIRLVLPTETDKNTSGRTNIGSSRPCKMGLLSWVCHFFIFSNLTIIKEDMTIFLKQRHIVKT